MDGSLAALRCEPPLTVRRVRTDAAEHCGLCLVGTAAGPLAGDDLMLALLLDPGARATLSATGASIAQGRIAQGRIAESGSGEPARLQMFATLGARAELVADPGALIVCAGSRVDVSVTLDLAPDATVQWRELVVLGRTRDPEPGAVTIRWDVTRAGRPVLRQFIDLADEHLRVWPGIAGGQRVMASALVSAPTLDARTIVASPTAVAQRLDATTLLVTVLSDSTAAATAELAALLQSVVEPIRVSATASTAASAK